LLQVDASTDAVGVHCFIPCLPAIARPRGSTASLIRMPTGRCCNRCDILPQQHQGSICQKTSGGRRLASAEGARVEAPQAPREVTSRMLRGLMLCRAYEKISIFLK